MFIINRIILEYDITYNSKLKIVEINKPIPVRYFLLIKQYYKEKNNVMNYIVGKNVVEYM